MLPDRNQSNKSPHTDKSVKRGDGNTDQRPSKPQESFFEQVKETIQNVWTCIARHDKDIKELRGEIKEVRITLEKLEKRYEEVDQRMAYLITAISKEGRDPIATYTPQQKHTLRQPYQLCNEYRNLIEEGFEDVTDDLLGLLPTSDEPNTTVKVAFIKATLSGEIFLANSINDGWDDETLIIAIANSIYTTLCIAKTAIPDDLHLSLEKIIKQGRQLAMNIRNGDPVGELITYNDVAFDDTLHKAMAGYKNGGTVISTVLPAYVIENHVQEKALVLTDRM